MSVSPVSERPRRVSRPANDNEPAPTKLRAEVLIPANSPITLVEIEVFAALIEDWSALAANDNEAL